MSGKQILTKKKFDSFCLPLRKRQEVLSVVFKQNTYQLAGETSPDKYSGSNTKKVSVPEEFGQGVGCRFVCFMFLSGDNLMNKDLHSQCG